MRLALVAPHEGHLSGPLRKTHSTFEEAPLRDPALPIVSLAGPGDQRATALRVLMFESL
jgi:hypothetical protein